MSEHREGARLRSFVQSGYIWLRTCTCRAHGRSGFVPCRDCASKGCAVGIKRPIGIADHADYDRRRCAGTSCDNPFAEAKAAQCHDSVWREIQNRSNVPNNVANGAFSGSKAGFRKARLCL